MVEPAPHRVVGVATSVSWIPATAVAGWTGEPFDTGPPAHDAVPPDRLTDLAALSGAGAADEFRFANRVSAWAEVAGGEIVDAGFAEDSRGVAGGPAVRPAARAVQFASTALPLLRETGHRGPARVVFRQTFGGRVALPVPRRALHPPDAQVHAPLVWTTVELTLHPDGRVDHRLAAASLFPRHRLYDGAGAPCGESGEADFDGWARTSFAEHSPWGGQDSPTLLGAVESALERDVAPRLGAAGVRPEIRVLQPGAALVRQGERAGAEVYLVLGGVLVASVDGREVGLLGPGTVLGVRALREDGIRTTTVAAETPARVAVATAVVPAAAADQELPG